MNDTIMSADDIERKLGMNVLGTLPLEAESEYDGRSRSKNKKKRPVTKAPALEKQVKEAKKAKARKAK